MEDLSELRFIHIKEDLVKLKSLCQSHFGDEEPEDTMLLETMIEVLNSLEITFIRHFQIKTGHIYSPKSIEPWD